MRIENEVTIEAPIEDVWALTIDVEGLSDVAETFVSVRRLDEGPIRVGSTARVKQAGQGERTWTVTTVEAPDLFAWETYVAGTRMLATHRLTSVDHGTRNHLTVELTGRGSRLVGALAGRRIRRAIATENAGFKQRAERVG